MERSEMIRRLDDAAKQVQERLANGPLAAEEQHAIAASLLRLLPVVADSLQDQIAADTARKLGRPRDQE